MTGATSHLINRKPLQFKLPDLTGKRIIVTGSSGFIGRRLFQKIEALGGEAVAFDLSKGDDVLNYNRIVGYLSYKKTHGLIHLAAHKYATTAEAAPAQVAELNIQGTQTVAMACTRNGETYIPFVLASTCKAADPCTAYGASKLIAERIAVNHGGRVIRLVNVVGSTGSVIDIWNKLPRDEPLGCAPGLRHYITEEESVDLFLTALDLKKGIYSARPSLLELISTNELAHRYSPSSETKSIPLRRGDRLVERLVGEYETCLDTDQDDLIQILGPWDERP